MEFFLPGSTPETRDSVYAQIRAHIAQELDADLSARRIRSLSYTHNGKKFDAEVGELESGGEGIVVAILFDQSRSLYLVCTPDRGIIRGGPILVGGHDVYAVSDFDQ